MKNDHQQSQQRSKNEKELNEQKLELEWKSDKVYEALRFQCRTRSLSEDLVPVMPMSLRLCNLNYCFERHL